jgi:hypothetical protein
MTLAEAIAAYGAQASSKLSAIGAVGQPEDQLRNPVENLLGALAALEGETQRVRANRLS